MEVLSKDLIIACQKKWSQRFEFRSDFEKVRPTPQIASTSTCIFGIATCNRDQVRGVAKRATLLMSLLSPELETTRSRQLYLYAPNVEIFSGDDGHMGLPVRTQSRALVMDCTTLFIQQNDFS